MALEGREITEVITDAVLLSSCFIVLEQAVVLIANLSEKTEHPAGTGGDLEKVVWLRDLSTVFDCLKSTEVVKEFITRLMSMSTRVGKSSTVHTSWRQGAGDGGREKS